MVRIAKANKVAQEESAAETAKGGLRAFRKSSDLEQFYRFVHENGLRREAFHALEYIVHKLTPPKKRRGRGKKAKKLQ